MQQCKSETKQAVDEITELLLQSDFSAVELKLRELLAACFRYEPEELAKVLAVTRAHSSLLPTWQPLLNQAIFVARQHGEIAEHIFYGIMPNAKAPSRNTK